MQYERYERAAEKNARRYHREVNGKIEVGRSKGNVKWMIQNSVLSRTHNDVDAPKSKMPQRQRSARDSPGRRSDWQRSINHSLERRRSHEGGREAIFCRDGGTVAGPDPSAASPNRSSGVGRSHYASTFGRSLRGPKSEHPEKGVDPMDHAHHIGFGGLVSRRDSAVRWSLPDRSGDGGIQP